MNENELSMTRRKARKDTVKTESDSFSQDKPEGYLFTVQAAVGVKTA